MWPINSVHLSEAFDKVDRLLQTLATKNFLFKLVLRFLVL